MTSSSSNTASSNFKYNKEQHQKIRSDPIYFLSLLENDSFNWKMNDNSKITFKNSFVTNEGILDLSSFERFKKEFTKRHYEVLQLSEGKDDQLEMVIQEIRRYHDEENKIDWLFTSDEHKQIRADVYSSIEKVTEKELSARQFVEAFATSYCTLNYSLLGNFHTRLFKLSIILDFEAKVMSGWQKDRCLELVKHFQDKIIKDFKDDKVSMYMIKCNMYLTNNYKILSV